MRKLPRAELRRYVRETPFNRAEVTKLWLRFSKMDADGSGTVTLQASLAAGSCCHWGPSAASEEVCSMLCILGATCLLRRGMCMAVHGSPCFLSFSKAGQQALQSCFCSASGQIWETCCAPVPALPSA